MVRSLDGARFSNVRHRRAAFTLVEAMVSGVLLGTVLMMAVPTLDLIRKERRATDWQRRALIEVENAMDLYTARSWEDIDAETATAFAENRTIKKEFPRSTLKVAVNTVEADSTAKQVIVTLAYEAEVTRLIPPVQLTAWVYRDGGQP